MNAQLIGNLVRLRYKLLWANTRSRNGKIALFFTGYLLFVLIVIIVAAGGTGAGILAVRSGKAEFVARVVLTSLFIQSLLTSVILGFGLGNVFSDLELRRYPVNARERLLGRHLIGIIDPFWFLVLAVELGLALGLYLLGAAGFFPAAAAVLLLFVANYAAARLLAMIVARMMQNAAGGAVLMGFVMVLGIGMGSLGTLLSRSPHMLDSILGAMRYTPPFGAAAAMARSGTTAALGYAVVAIWIGILLGALAYLENRPAARPRSQSSKLSWESPVERVTAGIGVRNAPLVVYWIRFYVRNSRFRTLFFLALPLIGFLTFQIGQGKRGPGLFPVALGTFALVGFMGTSRFAVNQFGYAGDGFRRYFLLPVTPGAVLEAASRACILLGAPLIPLALLGWAILAPARFDPRMLIMLTGSAVTGLFGLHALGLWASIYGPRRGNYNQTLGNDLSLLGNIVVIGSILPILFGTPLLAKYAPYVVDPAHWWVALFPATAAWVFYRYSLQATGRLFAARRERLMAIVEGRG